MTSRVVAVSLFFMTTCLILGIWIIYLFVGNTETVGPAETLVYAFSGENEQRYAFIMLALAAVFSVAATIVLGVFRSRAVARAVLLGGMAQVVAFAAIESWHIALVAAAPLWWVWKVQQEG